MGMFFHAKPGCWDYSSISDPRWNCYGDADHVGIGVVPPEAEAKLQELKEKYGNSPSDLKFGWCKY